MPTPHMAHLNVHPFIGFSIHDGVVLASPPVPGKLPHVNFGVLNGGPFHGAGPIFFTGLFTLRSAEWWPLPIPHHDARGPLGLPYLGRTTDAGFVIIHIPTPPNDGLLPLVILLGSSISLLGASSVKITTYDFITRMLNLVQGQGFDASAESDMAANLFPLIPMSLNLSCWDPVPLPTDQVLSPNNVIVGITFQDFLAALVDFAIEFALSAVFAFGGSDFLKGAIKKTPIGKGFAKAKKLVGLGPKEGALTGAKKAVAEASGSVGDVWEKGFKQAILVDKTWQLKLFKKNSPGAVQDFADKAVKKYADDAAAAAKKAADDAVPAKKLADDAAAAAKKTADDAASASKKASDDAAAALKKSDAAKKAADEADNAKKAADDAADAAKDTSKKASDDAADAAKKSDAAKKAADEADNAKKAADDAAGAAQKQADQAAQAAQKKAGEATDAAKKADGAGQKAMNDALQETDDSVANARKFTDSKSQEAYNSAKKKYNEDNFDKLNNGEITFDEFKKGADDAGLKGVKDSADEAAGAAQKAADDAAAAAQKQADEAADAAGKAAKQADDAKKAAEKAGKQADQAKQAAEKAAKDAAEAKDAAQKAAKDAAEKSDAAKKAGEASDAAKDAANKAANDSKEAAEKAQKAAKEAAEKSDAAKKAADDAKDAADDLAKKTDDAAKKAEQATDEGKEKLLKEIRESYKGSWAKQYWQKMTEVTSRPEWVVESLAEVTEAAAGVIVDKIDALHYQPPDDDSLHPTITMTSDDTIGEEPRLTANTSPITVEVKFSQDVKDFTKSDITTTNATTSGFKKKGGPLNHREYSFKLTPTSQGLVTAHIDEGKAHYDLDGGKLNRPFDKDDLQFPNKPGKFEFTFDDIRPTVSLVTAGDASGPATNVAPITVHAVFSEEVEDFDDTDVVVSNATLRNFIAHNDREYQFELHDPQDGDITVDIPENVCQDAAENQNHAAATLTITFDSTPPEPSISSLHSGSTALQRIPIRVSFDEPVKSFAGGNLDVVNGGVKKVKKIDDATFDVDIRPIDPGEVIVTLDEHSVEDVAGNPNEATATWSIVYDPQREAQTLATDYPDVAAPDLAVIEEGLAIIG